ncbi:MAG: hypothetical protein CG439_128 [Methylococcaceae bacterium NSP1-2]|nr:STY4851/ECs_5259 family protein [Methylococcaceae bacterium]OYV21267.1 MAG: hypothetical protein CG439_128 [Methylococcaceae bacterium NSP1-2]
MQPKDWLKEFLTVRQLNKPNAQPLYRYRMTDDEFAKLQKMLEISVLFNAKHIIKISGWNAAFVIYAAEWWRRYYDGGVWSWQAIFAAFANQINAEQYNLIVELGLKRKVRVINGRSGYLDTIAIEGGLPVKQLNNADYLRQLFKQAIPNYLGLHNADSADAIAIIGDYAHHLSENFQAILGDMLCRVVQLYITHDLANKEHPIDYLNQHVPDWQAQFPLPINDPVAQALLADMINVAAQVKARQGYYYLQGKQLNFSSTPKTVYLGLPELWCVNSDIEINTPLLAKAVHSNAAWQVLTAEQQGIYELSLQDEQGTIQFHQLCALLPENFSVHFLPLNRRIVIKHSERAYISCDSPLVRSIDITENGRSIEFNASDTPPSDVDLMLRWGKSDRLMLTLPFPVCSAQLLDANGNKLSQVVINQLHGAHLRLLGENHSHERHLTLEFSLKDTSLNTNDLYFRDEVSKTGVVIELALLNYQQWLQELLAISPYSDSFVRLIVSEQGTELLSTNIMRPVQLPSQQITRTRHVSTPNEITNLADALTINDDALRQLFIRHQLKQLCIDFAADDWNTLREYQTDAPLIANEIWIAATLESRVLAALVLQLETAFMQRFDTELLVCWELIPVRDWLVIFTRYKNYLASVMEETEIKDIISNRIDKISALSKSLHIIAQLLKYQLCDDTYNELAFMQTADALPLITEQLEHEQHTLIERQANRQWAEFLHDELLNDWQTLPAQTQSLLTPRDAVIMLPLLVANTALTALPSAWQQSKVQLFKLRQLKAFDELWFTTAFTLLLAYLSQQPTYSQPLQQETTTMINSDENDLVAEIEEQLALANEEVQGLQTDVQSLQGGEEALEVLLLENQELNATIENLSAIIKKRDDSLRLLLAEVTSLNTKIREIRNELPAKK